MKKAIGIIILGLILLAGCSGGYDKEDETVLEKCADLSFKQMIQFLSKLQDTQGAYSQEGEGELKKIEQGKQWTPEKEQLIDNFLINPLEYKMEHKNVPKWSLFTSAMPYETFFKECVVLKKEDPKKFKKYHEK